MQFSHLTMRASVAEIDKNETHHDEAKDSKKLPH